MGRPVVLGIDPDTRTPAYAVCTAADVLEVGILPEDLRQLATVLGVVLGRHTPNGVVVEGQQIYPGAPAAPNDILKLGQSAGIVAGIILALCPTASLVMPVPADWKKQTPKVVNQARSMTHFGLLYARTEGKEPYCYPSGCSRAAKIAGAGRLNKGDWKHVGDALGLALHGFKVFSFQ